jgi:membrane protein implicated in regulation of membrane protease activity
LVTAIDKVFLGCLLGGLGLSLLMVLSAGALHRFRLPRLHVRVGLRLPRFMPRVHLPRLHAPKAPVARPHVRVAARPASAGQAAEAAAVAPELALFPPGTVPIFLGLFATVFGGAGLIVHGQLHWGGLPSVLLAIVAGLVLSLATAYGLWAYFLSGSGASEVRGGSPLGTIGHVSLAIPAGGVGAIAFMAEGKRVTMPARTKDRTELAQKTAIIIVDIDGHQAVVEETLPISVA